ncbi:ATP synthase subunit I [Rhizobium sp. RU35A]|uniref:N-ATPase subunit AtpR n=1 Tax=Rhizobium sp. RU35A TaxID=1907414 RepID=UPI001AED4628|nr:ATP synthase subunit I [Rhizobium sp. RU35A]
MAMIEILISFATAAAPLAALIGFAAGLALGLLHFLTLKRNTEFFAQGRFGRAFLLQLVRFGLLIVVMVVMAKIGAVALLAGLSGLLLSRALILKRERRAS